MKDFCRRCDTFSFMPKDRHDLRILLVEARLDQRMIDHEHTCLARAGRLALGQFDILDVTKDTVGPEVLQKVDAVFIGGTGDYSVAQDRPEFFQPLVDFTQELLEQGVPTLGLCYGFHLMAHAVGGRVETREDLEETGSYEVRLTEAGLSDPILGFLGERFYAQQGHHDVVIEMPDNFVRLADSERCYWQAFRHPDKPYYGLQFHPELMREDFMMRMRAYAASYASTPEIFAAIDARVRPTFHQRVIRAFLDRFVD